MQKLKSVLILTQHNELKSIEHYTYKYKVLKYTRPC